MVLLQGLGLSGRFWFDTPDELAAEGRRVLTPDNRGTGGSDRPGGVYRMRDLADDVAAVLDDAGIDRAYVMGISLGGMIAQHVALRHPDRVRGLALLATTPGLPHGRLPHPRALATLLSIPFLMRRRESTRSFYRLILPDKHVGRAPELLAGWPAAVRADPLRAGTFLRQFGAAATHSTGFRLRDVACPTLVVTGDEDVLIPPSNSHFLAKRIPRSRLWILPETGHGIPIQDRGVARRALVELEALVAEHEQKRAKI